MIYIHSREYISFIFNLFSLEFKYEILLHFLDEHGSADPKTYITDPCFVVTAILCNQKTKDILTDELDILKLEYFGKKSYVLHRTELLVDLKMENKKIDSFMEDLQKVLNKTFVIFQVLVDKEEAFKRGWVTKTVYRRVYRKLFENITKYSIAKNVRNIIFVEASSVNQDIIIYQNFFHFIANGIDTVYITHEDVKLHLTSLNFVTKINNDTGEQLADLFSKSGKHKSLIKEGLLNYKDLKSFEQVLLNILEEKLFTCPKNCIDKRKVKIYPTINSFEILSI